MSQVMSPIQMPIPRARHGLCIVGVKRSKVSVLMFPIGTETGNDQIVFYAGAAIAVITGAVAYVNCEAGAQQRAVNQTIAMQTPQMRVDAQQFDFIVGQVLTKAGLPLTRREK